MAENAAITIARFWSKVQVGRNDVCWPWRASCDRHGYGQFKGTSGAKPKRAHRVAYELAKGEVPAGLVLRHRCNNPLRCNPEHLAPGTQGDNHDDREGAGRCPREAGRFVKVE